MLDSVFLQLVNQCEILQFPFHSQYYNIIGFLGLAFISIGFKSRNLRKKAGVKFNGLFLLTK